MEPLSRRTFLAHTIAVAGAPNSPVLEGASTKTRLILLGTGGGPRPRKARSPSAAGIVTNNAAYVIDCDNGVARQLVLAMCRFQCAAHFLTHHHSDHNTDYGNLIWLAWESGLSTRVVPEVPREARTFLSTRATPKAESWVLHG